MQALAQTCKFSIDQSFSLPPHLVVRDVALDLVFASVYAAVALVFRRRPDDRTALFVSLALLTFGAATFADTTSVLAAQSLVWRLPVAFLQSVGATFGLFLYLGFPR